MTAMTQSTSTPAGSGAKRKRVLDPVDRMSETLFGLIMVLSFTCTLSVASAGREEVRTMLFAAIGCNLAWGIVDGILHALNSLIDRAHQMRLAWDIRDAPDAETVRRLIEDELPETVASALDANAYETIRRGVAAAEPPARARLTFDDLKAVVGVFLLVFLSTFPVVLPFIFIQDTRSALRASNGIALVMLFVLGYRLAPYTLQSPVRLGMAMVGIGVALVAITVALGG
jgi:VIT1/CCC1 family predicted Fe2+/Mn2+ transporter